MKRKRTKNKEVGVLYQIGISTLSCYGNSCKEVERFSNIFPF